MRVIPDGGEAIELGAVEAVPTISIQDYSLRETDDFGVTTVVPRGFARRMAVKLVIAPDDVDALQRTLADLRATPAMWIADERFGSLSFRGFYKDFEIDLAGPPFSYCTLTVEGLVVSEPFTDTGIDPAPYEQVSTLQLLQPATIEGSALIASSVSENDYAEWNGAVTYPNAARVIVAAQHRVYESAVDGNAGNDPAGITRKWIDIGPTNRWAMFDQALGTATTAAGSISVELQAGAISAVALLDVAAANVRVQIGGYYDQTKQPTAGGTVTFLGIPDATVSAVVTISGPGTVSVGTLLIGQLVDLGLTETSPTAGITDFSRKETDEFGEVTVVPRAWAKRMNLSSIVRTDALDVVAGRIAAVRAQPSLWIGADGLDSLTIYGFFKDFSIAVGEGVSNLSLSIEGLSTAGKIEPLKASIDWPDIGDPDGTKPQDNADVTSENTSKDTAAVGGVPSGELVDQVAAADMAINDIQDLAEGILDDFDGIRDRVLAAEGEIDTVVETQQTQDASITQIRLTANTQAGDLAELTTRVAAGNPNLLRNGGFEAGIQPWNPVVGTWTVGVSGGWGYIASSTTSPSDGTPLVLDSDAFRVFPSTSYTVAAESVLFIDGGTGYTAIEVQWLDGNNAVIDPPGQGPGVAASHDFSTDGSNRAAHKVTVTSPVNAVYGRVRLISHKASGILTVAGWRQVKAEQGMTATAYSPEASLASYSERITAVRTDTQALAERAELLEAQVGAADARISDVETVAAQAGQAVVEARQDFEASAGDLSGRITESRSVAVDALNRTAGALYQQTVSVNGTHAQMSMYALLQDGTPTSGIDFVGDTFTFTGDVVIDGTLKPRKIDASLFAREGTMSWSGFVSPAPGQTVNVPASLTLNPIQPQGRFFYEVYIGLTTNAGQQTVGTYLGKPYYTNYQADGGLALRAYDDQGNTYYPVHGTSEGVRATSLFSATFAAAVTRGNYDSGIVNEGDYYSRTLSATYTLSSLNLHITWIAV